MDSYEVEKIEQVKTFEGAHADNEELYENSHVDTEECEERSERRNRNRTEKGLQEYWNSYARKTLVGTMLYLMNYGCRGRYGEVNCLSWK